MANRFHWNNVDYVVLVDLYSRYFEVSSLRDTRAQTVINKLKSYFSGHGISDTLISENGPQFSCTLFVIFARNGTSDIHLQAPFILKLTPQREQFKQSRICSTKLLRIKKDPYLAILAYRNTPVDCGKSSAQTIKVYTACDSKTA